MVTDIHKYEQGRSIILFDAEIVKQSVSSLWGEVDGLYTAQSIKRGQPCFFVYDGLSLNVRHYRRGGLIEPLLRDLYLGIGRKRNRAFDEFRLLELMCRQGLPVPVPVSARVQTGTCVYRADLITLRIPGALSLAEILLQTAMEPIAWRKLGGLLAHFHRAGICHADLNAGNILRDEQGDFFLIDFDRGRQRSAGGWAGRNLERLLRSFTKLQRNATSPFFFTLQNWRSLLDGYGRPGVK